MDYRTVSVARDPAGRRRPGFVPGMACELQFPRARCSLVGNALTVQFSQFIPQHVEFVEWVADVVMGEYDPDVDVAAQYTVKLNLFGNVPFFDRDGTFRERPPDTLAGCAVLVELRGWWYTASGAAGPRWHVLQVREADPPEAFAFVN